MRGKKLILLIAFLAVGVVLGFIFIKPKPLAPRLLPNPNGYDEVVAAAKQMPSKHEDVRELSEADLRAFVQTNASLLQLVHRALQESCAVSDRPFGTNNAYMDNLSSFKRIAFCFVGAGSVAEKEHRYAEAADHYLDAIRLGAIGLKDGVIIDRLVAVACETIGTKPLKTMVEKLSAKECRDVIASLENIEQQRDPVEKTFANEKDFIRREATFSQRVTELIMYRTTKKVEEGTKKKENAVVLLERQLMIALAARAFELEKGKQPTNVQELAPEFLKTVPQDPTTGNNLSL